MAWPHTDSEQFETTEPWDGASDPDLPLTELGMARRLVANIGQTARYVPEWRTWFFYDEKRWAEDLTGEIDHGEGRRRPPSCEARFIDKRDELTRAWLRFQPSAGRAIVELADEPSIPITIGGLDADPWAFNLVNGRRPSHRGGATARPCGDDSKIVPNESHEAASADMDAVPR